MARALMHLAIAIMTASLITAAAGRVHAESAPDFSFTSMIDGKYYRTADYRGKPVVLVFGSIYCRPCIGLLPLLNNFYDSNKSSGVLVIGVDVDRTTEQETIKKFIADQQIRFPFFVDTENIARTFKVFMLPTVVFIDAQGSISKRCCIGSRTYAVVETELKRLETHYAAGNAPCATQVGHPAQ